MNGGIGGGIFVAVVGPSGAGKDTLIGGAQARLASDPRFLFPRRIVTRASSGFEAHEVMAPEAFRQMEAEGRFALSWTAHGLGYAIPQEAKAALERGAAVVCNLSRRAVAEARTRLGPVAVVLVTAPREVLAERLGARGRESAEDIARRLERDAGSADLAPDCVIENVGPVEANADRLSGFLRMLAARATIPAGAA